MEYPLKIYTDDDYRMNALCSHKIEKEIKTKTQTAQQIIDEVKKEREIVYK